MNQPGAFQVVLAGFYPPPFGGESVHMSELANRLRAIGMLKKAVNLRRGAASSPEYVNGAGAVRLSSRLVTLLQRGTLLHLHTNGHSWKSWRMILSSALMLRFSKAVGVLTLHSGMSPAFLDRTGGMRRSLLRWGLGGFARVVCVNEEIRRSVSRLGFPESRCVVIPAFLGIRAGSLGEADEHLLSRFRPLVSVVAGDGPEYGVALIIDAIARLKSCHPAIGCIVVGTHGPGEPTALVGALGLTQEVCFLGPQPHDRCLALVARSDVFARPSLVDGDAISVREAISMGVPAVASRTASRPKEARLFRVGDGDDLARRIDEAIREERTEISPAEAPDFFARLLSVYAKATEERR